MPADHIDTVVGAQVELKGSLHNHGSIQIHGKVTGDVHSDETVIIGETAVVTGPITAKVVDVAGQVHGSITAEQQIELQPKSMVKGDLSTRIISIKPGAAFIGKSSMLTESSSVNADVADEESESEPTKRKPRLEID